MLDVPTVLVARTDALAATLLTTDVDERDRAIYETLDRAHYPALAYNSGVMSVDDSPLVHALFDEWHRRWLLSRDAGKLEDQQALNSTIAAQRFPVDVLDPDDNAMILYFPQRFRSCRVAHFLASTRMSRTLLSDLVDHFHRTQQIDWEAIDICMREGHPWGRAPEPWQLLRSGNYMRATWKKVQRTLKASP